MKTVLSIPRTISRAASVRKAIHTWGSARHCIRALPGNAPVSDPAEDGWYLVYHSAQALVGRTLHFELVVEGNTMPLTAPVTPDDRKTIGGTLTEVYVRKD
jgi:hypothetical protein